MMNSDEPSLLSLYTGWDDNQISLVRAVARLTPEQLSWRPAPHLRSVGEVVSHIIGGRVQWFHYVLGAGSDQFTEQVAARQPDNVIEKDAAALVYWLKATWQMIEEALSGWTVADLPRVYRLPPYQGELYALTQQWIIWRVLSHDVHHGGQLAIMLGMLSISIPELGDEGGHLAERAPLVEPF
jgi:uncharacterized damage-inducible protein DinB